MQPASFEGIPAPQGPWTPFRLIVLGAALGFGSSVLSAGFGLVLAFAIGSGAVGNLDYAWVAVASGVAGVLGPVGFFLVLYGLARALRSAPGSATPVPVGAVGSPDAGAAPPRSRWTPFRVAVTGAVLALVGGLSLMAFYLFRYLDRVSLTQSGIAVYEETTGTIVFLLSLVEALGSFIAFSGIALSLRGRLSG